MDMRKIRGIEDSEAHDRKRLMRDVRTPVEKFVDVLKSPNVQLGGIGGAGVCLIAFPACCLFFFAVGVLFFVLRCVTASRERLPFRMPIGLSGVDRGDPLPGRRGYAKPEGIFFLGNRLQSKEELWLKAKDILTHTLLFGTTGHRKRAVLHRPESQS